MSVRAALRSLLLLIIIGSFAFLLGNFQQLRLGNSAVVRSGTGGLWVVQQLEFELMRFLRTADKFNDGTVQIEELGLRLDMLWSRLPPLKQGLTSQTIHVSSNLVQLVTQLEAALQSISDLIDSGHVDNADLDRAIRVLEEFTSPVHDLTLQAMQLSGAAQIEVAERMNGIYWANVTAACGLGISTLSLLLLLLRQLRTSHELLRMKDEAKEKIEHLAFHDVLTELPNRRMFDARLAHELYLARQCGGDVGLHFIDIDHFKSVNDSLGHTSGDALLRAASSRLAGAIRKTDTLARIAGDEFAVIQPALTTPTELANLASRMLSAFEEPIEVNGCGVRASVSIGSTAFPKDGSKTETLLANADIALHSAKSAGRGRNVPFDEQIMQLELRRRRVAGQLRQALEAKEFSLRYQPIFSTDDGSLVRLEALLRWDGGQHEEVSPAEFIPMAE